MGFMINEFPWELRYPTIHHHGSMDSERGTACCGAAEKEVSLQALQALEAEAREIPKKIFLAGGGGNSNIFGTGKSSWGRCTHF